MIKQESHIKFLCAFKQGEMILFESHPTSQALESEMIKESMSAIHQINRLELQSFETQRINSSSGQWNCLKGTINDTFFLVLASHTFPERQSYLVLQDMLANQDNLSQVHLRNAIFKYSQQKTQEPQQNLRNIPYALPVSTNTNDFRAKSSYTLQKVIHDKNLRIKLLLSFIIFILLLIVLFHKSN